MFFISVNETLVLQRVEAVKEEGGRIKATDIICFANETLSDESKKLPENSSQGPNYHVILIKIYFWLSLGSPISPHVHPSSSSSSGGSKNLSQI